jgi:hypothetical protein
VHVIHVESNHDRLLSYFLGHYLQSWFRDDEGTTFDLDITPYKFYSYGTNLLGMTHGDGCKLSELPLLMATLAAEFWADAEYKEWLTGHLHTEKGLLLMINEKMGVRMRVVPATCRTDHWHLLHAFIGNHRAAAGQFYHKEYGPAGEFPVFLEEV